MSQNKAKRHTHKYYKLLIGGAKVWACALPDCNHYMPDHMKNMVNGKFSFCWKCGEQFTLNIINMKSDKPLCNECNPVIGDEPISHEEFEEYLKNKGV